MRHNSDSCAALELKHDLESKSQAELPTEQMENEDERFSEEEAAAIAEENRRTDLHHRQMEWIRGLRFILRPASRSHRRMKTRHRDGYFKQDEVESVIESLEQLCGKLSQVKHEMTRAVKRYRVLQVSEVDPYVKRLRVKILDLEEEMNELRSIEAQQRDVFDTLSHRSMKAKKTIKTARSLFVGNKQQLNSSLKQIRVERDEAVRELEAIISRRNHVQSQVNNLIGVIENLCAPIEVRNYTNIFERMQSKLFPAAVGETLTQRGIEVASMARMHREAQRRGEEKLVEVEEASRGLQSQIISLVSLYWK